jgi:hypothetical protein
MPTSDADLDDQLRAAMKTLDDEVPSGYFEALPDLTLARLEGQMQHGTQGTTDKTASAAPPPVHENTEDSGLHDIRNLAQSTKQRLSSKRITVNPPLSDDDLIASSSAGWKAVALPQPAKMVALPELEELPSKKEVLAKEKAAAKAEKKAAEVAAPAAAAVEARKPAFALPSAQPKKSKAGVFAVVGIGLAAAAGAAIFIATQHKDTAAKNTAAPAAIAQNTTTVTPIAPTGAAIGGAGAGSAAVSADVQKAQDEVAKAEADAEREKADLAAAQAAAPAPAETKADTHKATKKGHGTKEKVETTPVKTEETKPADKGKDLSKKDAPKTGSGDSAEPDFNELLKEAGVKDQGPKKQVLAKKELTADDFKNGMSAVSSKAAGCFKGTQGTAMVKMTIAPSGQIASVKVTGQFASTPEGACVTSAVKGASFPPWDGHPASFTYPILLSE